MDPVTSILVRAFYCAYYILYHGNFLIFVDALFVGTAAGHTLRLYDAVLELSNRVMVYIIKTRLSD